MMAWFVFGENAWNAVCREILVVRVSRLAEMNKQKIVVGQNVIIMAERRYVLIAVRTGKSLAKSRQLVYRAIF
jgi:hypothetical protein